MLATKTTRSVRIFGVKIKAPNRVGCGVYALYQAAPRGVLPSGAEPRQKTRFLAYYGLTNNWEWALSASRPM